MKKLLIYCCLTVAALFTGCYTSDIEEIKDDLSALTERVESLESIVSDINSQISALQSLVSALEANDYVTGVSSIYENGSEVGFVISFTYSDPITIYNGSDGDTPTIGVGVYEGEYYWTVQIGDGEAEWLLDDDGNMIPTTGEDGADGQDGQDGADGKDGVDGVDGVDGQDGEDGTNGTNGVTPVISVASYNDVLYWQVNGSWLLYNGEKVPATGEDGSSGSDASIIYTDNGDSVTIYIGDASFTFAKAVDSISFTSYDNVILSTATNALEIIIPQNLEEDSFAALVAEVSSVDGAKGSEMVTKSEAGNGIWGIDITAPVYEDGSWSNAKIKLALPDPVGTDGESITGVLTVSLINTNGSKSSTSLVFTFMTDEKVAIVSSAAAIADISGKDEITELILGSEVTNENIREILAAVTDAADGLTNVTVLDLSNASIDEVPEGYFNENTTLEEVIIAEGTSIADGAFEDCTNITTVSIGSGTVATKTSAVTRAETVTSIGASAFAGCTNLEVVNYCSGITEVGVSAFDGCKKLETIDLPSVTTIGEDAFAGCELLKTITLATDAGVMLLNITDAFDGDYVAEIDLTLGSSNYNYVLGNILTVGNYTVELGSITLIDANGNVIEQAEASSMVALADLSASNIPEYDLWIITDTTAQGADFAGLIAAIEALDGSEREISLEFPYLEAIPDYAMMGGSNTNSGISGPLVSIKADVATSIGDRAFYQTSSLISIEFPEVTSIGSWAFYNCASMSSMNLLKASLIGEAAFYHCHALTSVELPEATVVSDFAFSDCYDLPSIEFPKATSIGCLVFRNCDSLDSFTIVSTVTEIGGGAFVGCSSLVCESSDFVVDGSILCNSDKTTIISAIGNSQSSLYSDSATAIEAWAFYNCTSITSIKLPKATTIGEYAFWACTELITVELPAATSIGVLSFGSCSSLTSIELPEATTIGNAAFSSCSELTSINLPKVTSIDMNAFESCSRLTEISLATDEDVVLSGIISDPFSNISTTDITLTLGLSNSKYVNGNTLVVDDFSAEFKEIIIVDGDGEPCLMLANISADNIPADDTWVIYDTTAQSADFAGLSAAIVALSESERKISLEFPIMEYIPGYAMMGGSLNTDIVANALVSVKADAATAIQSYAFFNCTGLTSIELPSVDAIGLYAFGSCSSLTSIDISTEISIAGYAFRDCTNLSSVNLPKVTAIKASTFNGCTNLKSIELLAATSIGDTVFQGCTILSSVNLPMAISIGEKAFYECTSLNNFTIASTVSEIGGGAFVNCDSLTSLTSESSSFVVDGSILYDSDKTTIVSVIGNPSSISSDTATSIKDWAFSYCNNITSVELPEAIIIGNAAFMFCSRLATIELPKATTIGEWAFTNYNITTIKLPAVTSIGSGAFGSCYDLVDLYLATNEGVVLSDIDSTAFSNVTTTNIDLTIGSANSEYVSENTLTISDFDFSADFKSITVQ